MKERKLWEKEIEERIETLQNSKKTNKNIRIFFPQKKYMYILFL